VITLDFRDALLGVDLHELRVLVGRHYEEIMRAHDRVQVNVRLTQWSRQRCVQECGQIAPTRLGRAPRVERPFERPFEPVLLRELAEVSTVRLIVLVVEVPAASCGKP